MNIELTVSNAGRFYAQPEHQLGPAMRRVFDKFRDPETGGYWIDEYLRPLNDKITMRARRLGPAGGLSPFMKACVEESVLETLIELAQHPRPEVKTIVMHALDTLVQLITVSEPNVRKALLRRASACNALGKCLDIMETAALCLDRYTAARAVRALTVELTWGPLLEPRETGGIISRLVGHAVRGVGSYSSELSRPERVWQVTHMISRRITKPDVAAEYGKRWFGLTQELCLFSAHSLVCVEPRRSRKYVLEVLQTDPAILDLLLDFASMPRSQGYPESSASECAMEVLALLLSWSGKTVPGLNVPFQRETEFDWQHLKHEVESEDEATLSCIELLVSRPSWNDKLMSVWKYLDSEQPEQIESMLKHAAHQSWGGMDIDEETHVHIYSERGHTRILVLYIITAVTHSSSVASHHLVSFLPVAYWATKHGKAFAADAARFRPRDRQHLREHVECIAALARTPLSLAYSDTDLDPQLSICELAITGPITLLRLLTVLAERGLFKPTADWKALPEGCDPTTSLSLVRQAANPAVVSGLLSTIFERLVAHREKAKRNIDDPVQAKPDYYSAAELAMSLISFDRAVKGRWRKSIRGVWKELVFDLGNATAMCLKLHQDDAALCFILAAVEISDQVPPDAEPISSQVKDKNERRWKTARENLQRSQTDD